MEANKIQVVDDQGNEIEFEVLFTFNNEENEKQYVLYFDPSLEEPSVYASVYDDEGNLFEIEDPKEREMIEEVFQSFVANEETEEDAKHTCCGGHHGEEHECCKGHDHDEEHECCKGHDHDEEHECCGGHGDCECNH